MIAPGDILHSRRVLRFVESQGKNRLCEVECLNCGSPPEVVQVASVERSGCRACAMCALHSRQRAPVTEAIARMSRREMERLMRRAIEYGLYGRE